MGELRSEQQGVLKTSLSQLSEEGHGGVGRGISSLTLDCQWVENVLRWINFPRHV